MTIQLPRKTYFHLDEIAKRWKVEVRDLIDFGIDGHLELSTLVSGVEVAIVHIDELDWQSERLELRSVFGLQPIFNRDLIDIVNIGMTRIARFKAPESEHCMRLVEGQRAIVLTPDRLLVAWSEVNRFEAVASGRKAEPEVAGSILDHKNNFTEVKFAGQVYHFGLGQARVIEQLYVAAQTDNPWRRGHELLTVAKCKSHKLSELFKRKKCPNWRDLVISDRRGLYRLAPPAKTPVPDSVAYRSVVRAFRQAA